MRLFAVLLCTQVLAVGCFAGCGQKNEVVTPVGPTPAPPPPAAVTFDQVATIIAANCAKCHNGTEEPAFTSAAVFRASPAKAKLVSGQMPPSPATISAADKATLLTFLGG